MSGIFTKYNYPVIHQVNILSPMIVHKSINKYISKIFILSIMVIILSFSSSYSQELTSYGTTGYIYIHIPNDIESTRNVNKRTLVVPEEDYIVTQSTDNEDVSHYCKYTKYEEKKENNVKRLYFECERENWSVTISEKGDIYKIMYGKNLNSEGGFQVVHAYTNYKVENMMDIIW